ncbi:extensin [Iris pallida]|uniref:Extensin n=1 Tax=Iris pallida TaxID=29817 RepID=A0AAX6GHR9_IRIPA|nr:extensin [Iris pallida]
MVVAVSGYGSVYGGDCGVGKSELVVEIVNWWCWRLWRRRGGVVVLVLGSSTGVAVEL